MRNKCASERQADYGMKYKIKVLHLLHMQQAVTIFQHPKPQATSPKTSAQAIGARQS